MKLGYIILFTFAISIGVVLFGEVGLLSAYRSSQNNAKFEARIENLQAENARLIHDIDSVQRNGRKLEHTIRSSLSLVAPDELLFEFQ
jgi:cell division protein FtsB